MKKYISTEFARKRRQERWKRSPGEARISSHANLFRSMRQNTQEETAKILGITRQRVQQIERNAIWKLRQKMGDML